MARQWFRHLTAMMLCGAVLTAPDPAPAHCDGLDGPVISAARQALSSGDVDLVLVWVGPQDAPEIRRAFDRTLAVRKLSPEAEQLADAYFFETVVRVHRAGEGAAYTGLKPAGRDLGAAIPLADQALSTGDVSPLLTLLTQEIQRGTRERFDHARRAKGYGPTDVEAGRDYVHAYVGFIHYVERIYQAARQPAGGHFPDGPDAPAPHHP